MKDLEIEAQRLADETGMSHYIIELSGNYLILNSGQIRNITNRRSLRKHIIVKTFRPLKRKIKPKTDISLQDRIAMDFFKNKKKGVRK